MISTLLPKGDVILDLGGANAPFYQMGYQHSFEKLYLIDLPPEDRHEMYRDIVVDQSSNSGEVILRYGDMTELSAFEDESVDLVWSGQSIEHITYEQGIKMCNAAYRVLKLGGSFCLDTPNRLITKIHTQDIGGGFIHPEHCIEYTPKQLCDLLEEAGFIVEATWGVCEMNNTVNTNLFCYEDFVHGRALTPAVHNSYIQYFHCKKLDS